MAKHTHSRFCTTASKCSRKMRSASVAPSEAPTEPIIDRRARVEGISNEDNDIEAFEKDNLEHEMPELEEDSDDESLEEEDEEEELCE